MLPERRHFSVEENEVLDAPMRELIKRWLLKPSGLEVRCHAYAEERPSEAMLAMLGQALFPHQSLSIAITQCESDAVNPAPRDEYTGALDLRSHINAASDIPVLLPTPAQLASTGTKRCYRMPTTAFTHEGLHLGIAGSRPVTIAQADGSRHTYVIGATGSGKSTLLFNLICQDIAKGEGVCLIDPHGDLYRDVLDAIPAGRAQDVVAIDPCDFERAVGINFLECAGPHPEVQKSLIVNEMIKIFDRLYDLRQTGGPMFEQYMRNALLLVMDSDEPGTLVEVPRLFEDENYRRWLKRRCKNRIVERFWTKQAERAGGEAALANMAPYVTSKLNQFTHNALLRPIIGQCRSTIDFRQVMDNRQILLVNLSKGLLGELDKQLLGMLLIGKLFFATLGRVDVAEKQRTPFHWYIDEFQNFATDTLAYMLSESRKFGVRLTLANQNMAQLEYRYGLGNLKEAVLGNVGNLIMFRLGAADSAKLQAYTFPELDAQDLQYLPDFEAAARLLKEHVPLRPFVFHTSPRSSLICRNETEMQSTMLILERNRARYTRPVEEIEREIVERYMQIADDDPARG